MTELERAMLGFGWLILGWIWLHWIGTRRQGAIHDQKLAQRLKKEIVMAEWRQEA